MNIVILGSPASGKGTQAELLAKTFDLYHLQTGEISRNLAEKDARIKKIVDSGELIPAEEMTMYVLDFLHKNKPSLRDILFEGFPRFISQYEALEQFLKSKGDDIDAVISLDVSEEEAIKRISSRRICVKCGTVYNMITNPPKDNKCSCGGELTQRKDDTPEAVRVRFDYYKKNTKELINYLDKKGNLIRVDGERPIDVISNELIKIVKERKNAENNN